MSLIELSVFCGKRRGENSRKINSGNVQVKAVVYKNGMVRIEDCARAHRAIMPRLELAFQGQKIYLEVSSPGIDRIIKDGGEFVHFIGRGVKCYRADISDWTAGVLLATDEKGITLRGDDGEIVLLYEIIAKARLDSASPRSGS
jgi:ribosome maturation factor RimP